MDKRIRSAWFVNYAGEKLAGGIREGVRPLESPKELKLRYVQRALKGAIRKEWEKTYGTYLYSISGFSRVLLVQIPYKAYFLNVTTEITAPIQSILEAIQKILTIELSAR